MHDILEHFPKHLQPRTVQADALVALAESWEKHDVLVVNLPVATGKSAIANTVASWSYRRHRAPAIILTPNNLLLDQYQKDYPRLPVLKAASRYYCETQLMSVERLKQRKIPLCLKNTVPCSGCDTYRRDLARARVVPILAATYHTFIAHRLASRYTTVILDEAHNLVPILQGLSSRKIWRHTWPEQITYPSFIHHRQALIDWLRRLPEKHRPENWSELCRRAEDTQKYICKIGKESYRDEMRSCVQFLPLDIRDEPKMFFTPAVKKIVMMSATIAAKDIEQLGLYTKRVQYLLADSPIPPAQRPVHMVRHAPRLSYQHQTEQLPRLVALLQQIAAKYPTDKGLVHLPYALASRVRPLLGNTRFLFHTASTKMAVYQQFRDSPDPLILVASGMYEGIDLPYDAGRFQIIGKIPYPSLAEPAIAYKAAKDPSWYQWETVKIVQQACGRICRGPEDYGITFIVDSAFNKLYFDSPLLWPRWFKQAVAWVTLA